MADIVNIETVGNLLSQVAEEYIEAGFSPVRAKGKAMQDVGWQNLDLEKGQAKDYFQQGDNIANRMGKTAGGNYATVDIDCPGAHKFRHYLPHTEMWHGREGNKYSHGTYRILGDESPQTKHFRGSNGEAYIDLLGEKSAVIMYPSIHPSGDKYILHGTLDPAPIKAEELLRAVNKMYLATLVLAHYPETGSRQDYALGVSGLLIKGGYAADEAREIIVDVATAAGDEECQQRADCVDPTAKKQANGEQIAGYTLLVDIVGEQPVKKMSTALLNPLDGGDLIENKKKAMVEGLNKLHAVCMVGGKAAILNEFLDPAFGHSTISLSGPADFKLRYFNKRLRVSPPGDQPEYQTYADVWLKHVDRRQYDGIVFDPQDTPENHYNLFHGFAVEPVAGHCGLFLAHLHDVICRSNDEHYDYLIRWMAHAIQRPWELPEVAIVIRGKQGTGKTTMVNYFGALFGQHFLTVTGMKQVTGQFNGHLADKLLICANEAIWGGDKIGEGVLKALITDPTAPVEYKFKDMINVRNFKRLIVTTNESWAVPIGVDDRRYVVLDVSDAYKEDKAYFAALKDQMDSGGTEALMEYLSTFDLEGFEVRNAPYSSSSFDIKLKSADPVYPFLFELLSDQLTPEYELEWQIKVVQSEFYKVYKLWCGDNKVSHPHAQRFFTTELRKLFPGLEVKKATTANIKGKRPREYRLPELDHARAQFQKALKSGPEIWDDDDD